MKISIQDIVKKDLFDLLGLKNLPTEKKQAMLDQALATVQNRVLLRIAAKLNSKEKEELFAIVDKQDENKMGRYLSSKNINLASLLTEEALLYKQEMSYSTNKL